MPENSQIRYLITTADENTWKFDRPVVFLGRWCLRYDRKNIWSAMDAVIAEAYGFGKLRKDENFNLARNIEARLFDQVYPILNNFHQMSCSGRFWRVILGHWLRRYVEIMLNRVCTLQECLSNFEINGTTIYSLDEYELATVDSHTAIWACNDDRWNNALYARILVLLGKQEIIKEKISDTSINCYTSPEVAAKDSIKKKIRHLVYKFIVFFLSIFRKDSDGLIINSYLSRKENIKLFLKLKQVPQFTSSPSFTTNAEANHKLRKEFSSKILLDNSSDLEKIVSTLVFELMPICFLEGFQEVLNHVDKLRWPKKPGFIFTSNNFDTDELFKTWTAIQVEAGAKYIVGQHGNNYGTYRYMNPSIEEITSDKFLTWGWIDGLKQHTPAFIFKTAGSPERDRNVTGGLVLIEDMIYQRLDTWDRYEEFEGFFDEQIDFVKGLSPLVINNLTIRLHHTHRFLRSFEVMRWNDYDDQLNIDMGLRNINHLIDESRLVVFSYDSTGMLETLSRNIPTIAFWKNELDHLRESARPYYKLLADAEIVHFSPKSAAKKINEIWQDVDSWWLSIEVQSAREQFCQRYARTSSSPSAELAKLLTSCP